MLSSTSKKNGELSVVACSIIFEVDINVNELWSHIFLIFALVHGEI
jgi:hypothetical protein